MPRRGRKKPDKPTHRRGRPPHEPTPETRRYVQILRATGTSLDHIAIVLGISETTMVKHYAQELEEGHVHIQSACRSVVIRAAMVNRDWKAAAYYLRLFGGPEWKPQPFGEDGIQPVQIGGTTIIIQGGLDPEIIAEARATMPADRARTNGSGTSGNGADHTD